MSRPYYATDIVIEHADRGNEGIVLITRHNPPYGLALPGGMLESNLAPYQNAIKEAKEETGLDIKIFNQDDPWVYDNPRRDPRARIIGQTFLAKSTSGKLKAGDDAKTAKLYSIDKLITLLDNDQFAFDHETIIKDYLLYKGINYLGNSAMIARFKPLHLGGALLLDQMCEHSNIAYIGIGSANRELSVTNPFTAKESKEMVTRFLHERGHRNFTTFYVPDFAHLGQEYIDGKAWEHCVHNLLKNYGINNFVVSNEWVKQLLKDQYKIVDSFKLIPEELRTPAKSTAIRVQMAQRNDWKHFVPDAVINYLEQNNLVERFRKKFGEETIKRHGKNCWDTDKCEDEKSKVLDK